MTVRLAKSIISFTSVDNYEGNVKQDVKVEIGFLECAVYKKEISRYSPKSGCSVIPSWDYVQCLCTEPGFYKVMALDNAKLTHVLS